MHGIVSADPHGVNASARRFDALVLALVLSILALCSWPVARGSSEPVACALLPSGATTP